MMKQNFFEINSRYLLEHHRLPFYLKPIFIGKLMLISSLRHPAYSYKTKLFEMVLRPDSGITQQFLSEYAQNVSSEIYIDEEDYHDIQEVLNRQLLKTTRSLSIGDTLKNSIKQANLLTFQMDSLYRNPYDDDLLSSQFQNSKNLSSLLLNDKKIHKHLYQSLKKQNHHYILVQPLLSSILLLSFAKHFKIFSDKEIQQLFLTSYFKDIGLSFIPLENLENKVLSKEDQELFHKHAENSLEILSGRVPLTKNYLDMISEHHFLGNRIKAQLNENPRFQQNDYITGLDSNLLAAIDILVAMTNKRPYRNESSVFEALALIKSTFGKEFPQEFKNLVLFLKSFLN